MSASLRRQLTEDIALEVWTLEESFPSLRDQAGSTIDLRGSNAIIGMMTISSLAAQTRSDFVRGPLLPLLFGAAWKVLDLLFERTWQANGGPARPSITAKVQRARLLAGGDITEAISSVDAAPRLAVLYAETMELRHDLIHRRVTRDATGRISPSSGTPWTSAEMEALCQAAAVIGRMLDRGSTPRLQSELRWWLNRLVAKHGLPALADAHSPRPLDTVVVYAVRNGPFWLVDTERAHAKLRSSGHGYPFGILRVEAPNNEFSPLEFSTEETPVAEAAKFNPDSEPHWP